MGRNDIRWVIWAFLSRITIFPNAEYRSLVGKGITLPLEVNPVFSYSIRI